jgi:hypothetical protein
VPTDAVAATKLREALADVTATLVLPTTPEGMAVWERTASILDRAEPFRLNERISGRIGEGMRTFPALPHNPLRLPCACGFVYFESRFVIGTPPHAYCVESLVWDLARVQRTGEHITLVIGLGRQIHDGQTLRLSPEIGIAASYVLRAGKTRDETRDTAYHGDGVPVTTTQMGPRAVVILAESTWAFFSRRPQARV